MQTLITYNYILIGLRMRFLQNLPENTETKTVIDGLKDLKKELHDVGFEVTGVPMEASRMQEILKEIEGLNPHDPIGLAITTKLSQELNKIETTLFAESSTKRVYLLPQRRYNGGFLAEENSKLLDDGVYENISEIAKKDFSSACKCLLYGEATASAFHMLRATEEVLKNFYYHHKRIHRLKKPMWGPMTQELSNLKKNRPSKVILDSLNLVRESYRNPTQHPEIFYDIQEAQNLFGVCIDLINKMILFTR